MADPNLNIGSKQTHTPTSYPPFTPDGVNQASNNRDPGQMPENRTMTPEQNKAARLSILRHIQKFGSLIKHKFANRPKVGAKISKIFNNLIKRNSPQKNNLGEELQSDESASTDTSSTHEEKITAKIDPTQREHRFFHSRSKDDLALHGQKESLVSPKAYEGADLRTAQGAFADMHALKTGCSIMAAMACSKSMTIENIVPDDNPPKVQFQTLMDVLKDVARLADLKNKDDCMLLNGLAGLLSKGFAGGIGTILEDSRDDRWNIFSEENAARGAPFKCDENNQNILADFNNMVQWYREQADRHFTPNQGRHVAGSEIASIQLAATFGQLVHDFILEAGQPAGQTLLKRVMLEKGLIKGESDFDELTQLEASMRKNPLLAEVPSEVIKSEIQHAFQSGVKREAVIDWLKKRLNALQGDTLVQDEKIERLANDIVDQFADAIGKIQFNISKTGARGRTATSAPHMKEATQALMGYQPTSKNSANETFFVMPHRDDDKVASNLASEILGKEDPNILNLNQAISDEHILFHKGSPPSLLRMGTGLDTAIKKLVLDPCAFLEQEIAKILELDETLTPLLLALIKDLSTQETKDALKELVVGSKNAQTGKYEGGIQVTFNSISHQRIEVGDFAEMKSVASIMYNNSLRTICSISGTTVDTVLGLTLLAGKAEMKKLLTPLLAFAENPSDFSPLNTPDGQNFKELFGAISFFMQGGQYHTAAEVLGGLLIAASALDTKENMEIGATFKMFEGVMKAFAQKPENFFALTDEAKEKISSLQSQKAIMTRLFKGKIERKRKRL